MPVGAAPLGWGGLAQVPASQGALRFGWVLLPWVGARCRVGTLAAGSSPVLETRCLPGSAGSVSLREAPLREGTVWLAGLLWLAWRCLGQMPWHHTESVSPSFYVLAWLLIQPQTHCWGSGPRGTAYTARKPSWTLRDACVECWFFQGLAVPKARDAGGSKACLR